MATLALGGVVTDASAGQPAQQRFFSNPRFPNRIGSFVLRDRFLIQWCRRDAQTHCPGISGGVETHSACVSRNYEKLSLGCQTAIDMVRDARGRQIASSAASR